MNHQINYNWYNEPFAVSRIDLFILRHAWLNLWDKRMLLAESTRLLSVESIYTLREYAILTTSQTSKTILRCRRRQTYSCVLRTLHQERYFWFSPSFTKDRTDQVQKCWWLNEFLTLRTGHGCRNDPMFIFVVFEICVWLYVLRWIGVIGFRWEMRTVIFKFFRSSFMRISPHYLNNHFWNSQKVFADFHRVPSLPKQIHRSGSLLSEVSVSVESVAKRFTSLPFLTLSQNLMLKKHDKKEL